MIRIPLMTFLGLTFLSCAAAGPPPLDKDAIPKTKTSAEPLYISTMEAAPEQPKQQPGKPEAAVEPTLPTEVTLALDRSSRCRQKHCWRSRILPKPFETKKSAAAPYPDLGAAPPVAVWQEILGAKVKLDYPRSKGIGVLGVVLGGVATVSPSEGGRLAALQTWGAFHAPGAGISVTAGESGATVVLTAYALQGKLAHQVAALQQNDKAVYWEKRPGAFSIVDLSRVPDTTWANGAAHARFGFEKKTSPQVYLGTLALKNQVPVANHKHGKSWEVLVPITAAGALTLSGKGAPPKKGPYPRDFQVKSGTVVTMPPGVDHSYKPQGTDPLVAIQLYIPPGPEQRFKKLAGRAGANEGASPPTLPSVATPAGSP